ncbi:hypothetical protein F4553_005217 [Allocatelliglobosispora scoriae]|uniref:SMI1/KNR4 family protein n=1 Tax=Allocatelliglobosispora scoriae TaxID=643052 RepID=A0A841BWI0_9ACTN|nr:hypothetical protein [Allocatelliglobosispora scoriae]MBB5871838.1 hypothetical protein [Allocatelliglobosispora scoriae]
MTHLTGDIARDLLRRLTAEIADGLTEVELDAIEARYGFVFATDHRAMLRAGLPHGRGWPDWRDGDPDELADRLRRPVEGVLFDVEEDIFWHPTWGDRPTLTADAVRVARRELASAPQLVPVYGHRYLPGVAGSSGHPVISVMQTDVIVYAQDLGAYLRGERSGDARVTAAFWRDLI